MRFVLILAALVVQFAALVPAQRAIVKAPEPATGPKPATEDNPTGATNPDSLFDGYPAGVPGALAVGQQPNPAPKDDEIDFDHIGEVLKDLIDLIDVVVDAADDGSTSTSTSTHATIAQKTPLTPKATPCTSALNAYSSCSTAYDGTFSAVAATAQAGCLCNADTGFDFNGVMENCYSYAQDQSRYRSYASVVASATAACSCVPNTVFKVPGPGYAGGCAPTATTTTTTSASAAGGSVTGASLSTPTLNGGDVIRSSRRASLGVGVVAAVLGCMSIQY